MIQDSKQLPWLRLYTEVVDDEKLGLLAFEDRWHFVALLCIKGKGILDAGDDLEMMQRKVAFKMGLTCSELEKVILRLSRMGLIDAATYQPTKWDARQMQSDNSTDRVKAYRERMKQVKRKGNVSVTAQDTDTDTDKDTHTACVGADVGVREVDNGVCGVFSEKSQESETPPPPIKPNSSDAEVISQLVQAGVVDAKVGNPVVLKLLEKGVSAVSFVSAADAARRKGRTDLPYVIGIVRRQAREATAVAAVPIDANPQWDDTRQTIESEGCRVGIGRWCGNASEELFSAYTKRVGVARSAAQTAHKKVAA